MIQVTVVGVFFAGDESQDYINNPDNISIYDVNTIANYDPSIIKYLDSDIGVELEKVKDDDTFIFI